MPSSWNPFNSHESPQRSFWHQLLVPSEFTSLPPATEENVELGGVFENLPVCVEGLKLCTDGSGGPFTSDPRKRRCSFSVVALRLQMGTWVYAGHYTASLLGPEQTVPRAETMAVLKALQLTCGDVDSATDALIMLCDDLASLQEVKALIAPSRTCGPRFAPAMRVERCVCKR